jgi:antitoxin (DNA-binding transcriptional repressor) of toxin-antitoxin stability system
MGDMRVNLRELHRRTGAVVQLAERGEVVVIEKRGRVVAEIRPARPPASGFPAAHWDAMKRLPMFPDDSGRFVSESRDRG